MAIIWNWLITSDNYKWLGTTLLSLSAIAYTLYSNMTNRKRDQGTVYVDYKKAFEFEDSDSDLFYFTVTLTRAGKIPIYLKELCVVADTRSYHIRNIDIRLAEDGQPETLRLHTSAIVAQIDISSTVFRIKVVDTHNRPYLSEEIDCKHNKIRPYKKPISGT